MSKPVAAVVLLGVLAAATQSLSQPAETREIVAGRSEKFLGTVTKSVGRRTVACARKAIFEIVKVQRRQCVAWGEAPINDSRMMSRAECKRYAWVTLGQREDFLRELVTECNPLGPPNKAY